MAYAPLTTTSTAAARIMLLQAAANDWPIPASELTVANGVITYASSNRTTTCGKVAAKAAKLQAPDPKSIKQSARG